MNDNSTNGIPFNRPWLSGKELEYISEAIRGGHASGNGPFTRRCQRFLERELGVKKAMLTTSCTDALEMCALLLDIGPGDEVIVPAYTFVSTANAFALRGARPVFADIRPDTLNIDEARLEKLITARTRAIVVVHYAGVACEMDAIMQTAQSHDITVVEDNAHGLFASYHGRPLGSLAPLATLSFHETKNISCGEGGALLINDPGLIGRAEILWEKGTNRARFFRGEVDRYTWVDIGSSFLPSDLLGAFLLAQLENKERIQTRRKEIWERYHTELADWAGHVGARLPVIPEDRQQSWHMFYLIMPTAAARDGLIAHLRNRDILSVFHYTPLDSSPMARRFGQPAPCPNAQSISERLLRLPFYTGLGKEDQDRVIEAVRAFHP
ncbi:MAG TPA: dTDP-4-amino-4,6-dideoxygalactose transaminase [Sedimenticola sp.]|nr:dTDP-4-amino-4,6-dideoxygalactose transaminase [Sedimenticola sp.]